MPGSLASIGVGHANNVWGTNSVENIYQWTSPCEGYTTYDYLYVAPPVAVVVGCTDSTAENFNPAAN